MSTTVSTRETALEALLAATGEVLRGELFQRTDSFARVNAYYRLGCEELVVHVVLEYLEDGWFVRHIYWPSIARLEASARMQRNRKERQAAGERE